MRSGNIDERLPGTYNPPANYGQMAPPANLPMAARQEYGTRVTYSTSTMSPPAAPGAYRNTGAYQPSEPNYTYSTAQPPGGYSVMDSSRDRMETTTGQPSWNMQPSSGYPSGATAIASSYAPARPTYNYSPVGGNPPVTAGYGRAEPQGSYDPYGPRGAYIHRPSFPLSSPQGAKCLIGQ
jgi:hypothetical protein